MANTGIYEDDYDSDSSVLGVDSDVESNFTDSPADGYFSERPHPRETFVENSSISAAAEAKARERAEERASSSAAAPPSQQSSPTSPTRPVEWAEVETPFVQQEAPPPDYESAISSRPSTQNYSQSYNHGNQGISSLSNSDAPPGLAHNAVQSLSSQSQGGSFTASGTPLTAQVVSFGRATGPSHLSQQPQSMRDANVIHVDEETGLLTGAKSKRKPRRWFGCCKSMSLCNVILFVAIVILVVVIAGAADDRSESGSPNDGSGGDDNDESPSNPVMPPNQPGFVPPSTKQCSYGQYEEKRIFDFEKPHNFTFVELMESSDWVSDNIQGKVTVSLANKEQDVDIRLWLGYAATAPWDVVSSRHVKTDDSLVLELPNMKKTDEGGSDKPCLWINVRIEVRPGVIVDNWELSSGNLDIEVEDGLFNRKQGEEEYSALRVTGSSIFNAVRGAARIDYWSSRETEVDVISGSIKGTFALLDLLSLNSQSGSITVDVDPKEADEKRPRPAEFNVRSNSGTVKVHYPQRGEIPKRQYSSRVETTSASISGDYILGELTSFHSHSGTIRAQLLPYFDPKQPSTVHTETLSGSTKLRVLQPYARPGEAWTTSQSKHKSTSTSGSIDVLYPDEWSGMIDEQSISGSLHAKGKGVKIISDGKVGPVYRHLMAQKGYGSGEIALKSTTGSVNFRIGGVDMD